MSKTKSLKPYPFCGEEEEIYIKWSYGSGRYSRFLYFHVECDICNARTKSYKTHENNLEDVDLHSDDLWDLFEVKQAKKQWNMRV